MKRRPLSRFLAIHLADSQTDETHSPAWMLTFGDLMTLLLVFFVMLASIGEYRSDEQSQNLWQAIHRQFRREADDPSTDAMVHLRGPQRRLQRLARQNSERRRRLLSAPFEPQLFLANLEPAAGTHYRLRVTGESQIDEAQASSLRDWTIHRAGPTSIFEVRGYLAELENVPAAEDSEDTGNTDNAGLAFRNLMLVRRFLVRELGIDAARLQCTMASEPPAGWSAGAADAASRVDLYLRHASYSELGTTHHVRTQSRR